MRVLIAEDQPLLRDGLTRMLTAYGFEVVAAVADGPSLPSALLEHRPDVAVVDVRLPPTFTDEGLRAAIAARRACPRPPAVNERPPPRPGRPRLPQPVAGADALGDRDRDLLVAVEGHQVERARWGGQCQPGEPA
ncbi:hypothetical protein GCM10022255_077080 [Dactylosporangium darangshiense]|uniref:Response regulatory domain-containing protein n=1 Tax=Dactylosporangium darangshiense TaxID=579108 RepID=A0ABP8DK40_9ACTN